MIRKCIQPNILIVLKCACMCLSSNSFRFASEEKRQGKHISASQLQYPNKSRLSIQSGQRVTVQKWVRKKMKWADSPGPGRWATCAWRTCGVPGSLGASVRTAQVFWWEGGPRRPRSSTSSLYRREIKSFREEVKWVDFEQVICVLLRWNLWNVLSVIFVFFKTESEISAVGWDA